MSPKAPRTDEPIFRFLQINDTHYQTDQLQAAPRNFAGANRRTRWLFESLRAGNVFPKVDFLLHLGDLVNTAADSEFAAFKELIDRTGIPYHTVVGNHDNHTAEGDAAKEAPYRKYFGERFNYTFTHKGLGFVIANNSGTATPELTAEAIRKRDTKLRQQLESHSQRPVVVACHVPLVPIRDHAAIKASFGIPTYQVAEPGMLKIVEEHRSHVSAVLSSHLHLSGVVCQNGINHIDVCGTASYPHEVALHSVFADAMETQFIPLPDELGDPETNIHGRPFHDHDFTDDQHPDHASYLRGNSAERLVVTPWKQPLSN